MREVDRRRSLHDQRGSMPLVLLVAIVIAGVVIVLFGQVRSSQSTARNDRDFTQAIQVADAGVQAAFTTLASAPPAPGQMSACGGGDLAGPTAGSGGPCSAATAPAEDADWGYTWRAQRGADGRWEIRSQGCFGDACRTVELRAGDAGVFPVMLFAQCQNGEDGGIDCLDISGGGSTDLGVYESAGFVATEPLQIGSNHQLPTISGNYGDTAILQCYGETGDCENKDPLEFPDLSAWAYLDPDHVDEDSPAYESEFLGLCHDETPEPLIIANGADRELTGDHCVSELQIGRSATVTVANGPARIFVAPGSGTLVQAGGAGQGNNLTLVNLEAGDLEEPPLPPLPDSTDLQIYVSGGTVDFSNNSLRIAATLYAPNSFCDFRSQATMFGAAICDTVDALGGFRFWYDQAASDIEGAPWTTSGWSEQLDSTSGFGWATS